MLRSYAVYTLARSYADIDRYALARSYADKMHVLAGKIKSVRGYLRI